MQRELY